MTEEQETQIEGSMDKINLQQLRFDGVYESSKLYQFDGADYKKVCLF